MKLRPLELGASEIITRAQLKLVLGGDGSGGTGGCYDLCVKSMTCALSNGQEGHYTKVQSCSGTDGNVYPIYYCS